MDQSADQSAEPRAIYIGAEEAVTYRARAKPSAYLLGTVHFIYFATILFIRVSPLLFVDDTHLCRALLLHFAYLTFC